MSIEVGASPVALSGLPSDTLQPTVGSVEWLLPSKPEERARTPLHLQRPPALLPMSGAPKDAAPVAAGHSEPSSDETLPLSAQPTAVAPSLEVFEIFERLSNSARQLQREGSTAATIEVAGWSIEYRPHAQRNAAHRAAELVFVEPATKRRMVSLAALSQHLRLDSQPDEDVKIAVVGGATSTTTTDGSNNKATSQKPQKAPAKAMPEVRWPPMHI